MGLEVIPGVVVPSTIAAGVTISSRAGDNLLRRVFNGCGVAIYSDDRLDSLNC
jgi:hypothetical protein